MKKSIIGFILVVVITGAWYLLENDSSTLKTTISAAEALQGDGKGFDRVMGPKIFQFPEDHGAHPGFRTEWWYYTGNVSTEDGRSFGYQFTIFRNQYRPSKEIDSLQIQGSSWRTNQLYLAHFAITDVEAQEHYHEERYSRGGAGLAGAESDPFRIWVEDWEILGINTSKSRMSDLPVQIRAKQQQGVGLSISLIPEKPVVFQGDQGYDQKGAEPGNASYYLSFTRMKTNGILYLNNEEISISGNSWMDHEWSTSALGEEQAGWDWFSIQLSNGWDIMHYQLRNKDGSLSAFTTTTLIDPEGNSESLEDTSTTLRVLNYWKSPKSGSEYPSEWTLSIPSKGITLNAKTKVEDQEMDVSVRYYEGSINLNGNFQSEEVSGNGYIEMTGY